MAQTVTGPEEWNNFMMGLLSDGECLIDDLRVIESPTDAPVEILLNGDFENGSAGWRLLGNHS